MEEHGGTTALLARKMNHGVLRFKCAHHGARLAGFQTKPKQEGLKAAKVFKVTLRLIRHHMHVRHLARHLEALIDELAKLIELVAREVAQIEPLICCRKWLRFHR